MIVSRWMAPRVPTREDIIRMLESEGLAPFEDTLEPQAEYKDLRTPFDEVRIVALGELLLDISGNKLLLRAGDRIMIPANTRQSRKNQSGEPCVCICARKM